MKQIRHAAKEQATMQGNLFFAVTHGAWGRMCVVRVLKWVSNPKGANEAKSRDG